LDGTGSQDPNGTSITYAWRFVTQPASSQAVLLSATSKTPSFTPQVAGLYIFALTVSDGALTSPSDEIVITVTPDNCPPVADAGPDQKVATGQVVTLTGTGSTDPNDDSLTYSWRFQSKPDGSTATVAAAASVSPTFTADLAGLYVLSLVVSDGTLTSTPDTVVIEATLPGFVNLVLQAYLKPSNTFSGQPAVDFFPGNQFGVSVAISGDTLAVGGPTDNGCAPGDCPLGTGGTGAVYVFTRTTGGWSQQAYVRASNPRGGNVDEGTHPAFGTSVALSGDTLAVGAPGEDGCATGVNGDQTNQDCPLTGAVYVFTRTNGIWAQQAYVKSSNTGPYAYFGQTLALTGDTLAVGSFDSSFFSGSGAVYVFTRTTGVWSQQAYLKASNADEVGDEFGGSAVALDGDGNTLAVGARGEDSCAPGINGDQTNNGCRNAGAVYVFTRTNGIWVQQAYIKASNPGGEIFVGDSIWYGDSFGSSVAISGDTLAVGARSEQSCASGINGDQTNNGCIGEGAVYVFTRANGSWAQQVYIKASHTGGNRGGFGWSVALNGNTLAVGRPFEGSCATGINGNQTATGCGSPGAVYVFKRAAGVWSQHFYVKASNTGGIFGTSVALSNERLLVGAPNESSCATGVNGNQADNNCWLAGAAYLYAWQ
jgi:PKD domain/FG-GAP repeat